MRYTLVATISALATASAASPATAGDDVIVLADKPGAKVKLVSTDLSKTKLVADGTIAKRAAVSELEPIGIADRQAVAIDGVQYTLPGANVCELHGPARKDGKAVYNCDFHEAVADTLEGFNHIWYAATPARRVKIAVSGLDQTVFFAESGKGNDVIVDGERMYIIDPVTNKYTKIKRAGAPSWDANGVLHYRTLNGYAWKFVGGKSKKLGKGKAGTGFKQMGDHGNFEATRWPEPVTFDGNNKPAWQ